MLKYRYSEKEIVGKNFLKNNNNFFEMRPENIFYDVLSYMGNCQKD